MSLKDNLAQIAKDAKQTVVSALPLSAGENDIRNILRRDHELVAGMVENLIEMAEKDDPRGWSHVRIATKYPHVTRAHFEARGVQAECIKLNGAMELAPVLGLAPRIVDLVSSGKTLKENGLVEVEVIQQVTSRLIVNRAAFKTRAAEVVPLVDAFRKAVA